MDYSSANLDAAMEAAAKSTAAWNAEWAANHPSKEELNTRIAEAELSIAEFQARMNDLKATAHAENDKVPALAAAVEAAKSAWAEQSAVMQRAINKAQRERDMMLDVVSRLEEYKRMLANYAQIEAERRRILGEAA